MINEKELIKVLNRQKLFLTFENSYLLDKDFNDGIDKAIQLVYSQPKVGEWISVEERLPEIQQDVLVTIKRRNISYCDLAFLDDNGRWLMSRRIGYIEGNVLAWQPLPEPYRVPLEKNSKGEQND